jgi:glutathione S-transferase
VGFTLYIGNKNYSSWSLRGWLAMRLSGAPFEEVLFHLSGPGERDRIRALSPNGRVPALRHDDLVISDSLAIAEYLAETFPERRMWPEERAARATARSLVAEMHSSFLALRTHMPMNLRRSVPGVGHEPEVLAEIAHLTGRWKEVRSRYGASGPYLFGRWTLADCFFAPVIGRFRTYGVPMDAETEAYADAVWAQPDVKEWLQAAAVEPMTEPQYER